MIDRRLVQYFDWGLLAMTLLLGALGIVTLYSAVTAGAPTPQKALYIKQLMWFAIGFCLMIGTFLFDYKKQKTFFHGHTYTGNPLCCAAALANLKVFKEEQTLLKLAPKIKYLRKRLGLFYNLESVGDVRQKGFMVGIELVKNRRTKEPYPWEEKVGVRVCQEVRKHGVLLRPLGNVIVLMPPLAVSLDELDMLFEVTEKAIRKVTEKKL